MTFINKTPYTAPPVISSRNKSLVSLHDNFRRTSLQNKNITNNSNFMTTTATAATSMTTPTPAFISPNNSSLDLHQQAVAAELEQQQQQQRKPSPRPLKKRKINMEAVAPATTTAVVVTVTNSEEETAVRRRKVLAAKLRENGVSRRMVLKPSDFARSVFVKNMNGSPLVENYVLPFPDPTATDIEIHQKHSQELYAYVRKGTDLEGFKRYVRELHQEYGEGDLLFRCCNRFGESLLHLACRRGRTEMVRFLVEELEFTTETTSTTSTSTSRTSTTATFAREMLTVRDDCNKTPLHDACWTPSPNFELVELILKHAPEQVLMQDVRGNTPFDYVRKEDYALWLKFLWQHKSMLRGVARTVQQVQ